jgi:hypothetical protein
VAAWLLTGDCYDPDRNSGPCAHAHQARSARRAWFEDPPRPAKKLLAKRIRFVLEGRDGVRG